MRKDQQNLIQWTKNFNEKLHLENLNAFKWVFEKADTQPIIWAAWGTNIDKRDYLKACLIEIEKLSSEYKSKWVKAGNLSKKRSSSSSFIST